MDVHFFFTTFLVDAMFNSINIILAQKVLINCNTWTKTLHIPPTPHSSKGTTNDVTVCSKYSLLFLQSGMTPLLVACYIDNTDLVRELLKADACVTAVNNVSIHLI